MSREFRLVPLVTIVLLAGSLNAQTDAEARARRLQEQNLDLRSKLNDQARRIAMLQKQLEVLTARDKRKQATADRQKKVAKKIDESEFYLVARNTAVQRALVLREAVVKGKGGGVILDVRPNDSLLSSRRNPLMRGEYKKSLDELTKTRKKLDAIRDPAEARRAIDAMSHQLIEVRRVLWEIEKSKKKAKNKGEGK